jgi:hypothetical protein
MIMAWRSRDTVLARVERHMGGKCVDTHIISQKIKPLEQVNLQLVLDEWLQKEPGSQLFGYSFTKYSPEQNRHFPPISTSFCPV